MESTRFTVTPEAARFIDRVLLVNRSNKDYVVAIAPQTDAMMLDLKDGVFTKTDVEKLKKAQTDSLSVDPRKMKFRWVVGVSLRSRFPTEDIFVYDGVSCFVPKEMRSILDGRTLTLNEGELRIEPEPLPPTV